MKNVTKKNPIVATKFAGDTLSMPSEIREYYETYRPFDSCNECCANCQNFAYGCEWSERAEPVPGWYARQTTKTIDSTTSVSYKILFCPKFLRDQPDPATYYKN